jgi:hypothetical protein
MINANFLAKRSASAFTLVSGALAKKLAVNN